MRTATQCWTTLALLAGVIGCWVGGCSAAKPIARQGIAWTPGFPNAGGTASVEDENKQLRSVLESQLGSPGHVQGPQLVPPQSLPAPDEELWIVAKPGNEKAAPRSDEPMPGQGQLMAERDDHGKQTLVPVPLKHTDVKASVIGYIATVDVQQQYQNPYDGKIEAVYVFPLPQNAAVN